MVFRNEKKNKMDKKLRLSLGSAAVLGLKKIKTKARSKTVYLMNSGGCVFNCSFCSQAKDATSMQSQLSRVTWPEYDADDIYGALGENQDEYKRVCMQVVNTKDVFKTLPDTVAKIRKSAPKTKIAMTIRTYDMADIDNMFAAGADEVGLSIDAIDPEHFKKIKGGSYEVHKKFVLDAADKYPNKIATHIIVGMGESERQAVELMEELHAHQVIIALFAFTPVRGAKMEFDKAPDLSSYRRIQLALHLIRNGVDRSFTYDEEGRIIEYGQTREQLFDQVKDSNVFETSGCSDCNRPYYNERAGSTDPYNHPDKVCGGAMQRAFDSCFEYV